MCIRDRSRPRPLRASQQRAPAAGRRQACLPRVTPSRPRGQGPATRVSSSGSPSPRTRSDGPSRRKAALSTRAVRDVGQPEPRPTGSGHLRTGRGPGGGAGESRGTCGRWK
eukprot:9472071-Pyramimonas_sp.AAC.1